MKNYASKIAQRGRTAYRMSDRFIYRKHLQVVKSKIKNIKKNWQ